MSSASIYTPIKPTYLYIKQHSVTGLKYFGKTTEKDPYKYSGSGTRWTNHIKKHGKDFIKTIWVSDLYYDTSIVEIALHFSKENNIVESNDWANLMLENGLDGKPVGIICNKETKTKISIANTGNKYRKGTTHTKETKTKISIANTGKIQSEKTKIKKSIANKGKITSEETKIKLSIANTGKVHPIVTCPHCNKTGGVCNMKRYHFDNCKFNASTELSPC
jgi:hypothetical protein